MEQLIQFLHLNITPGTAIVLASVLAPLVVFCRSLPSWIFNKLKDMVTVTLIIDEADNMSGQTLFKSFNSWVVKNRVPWFTRIYELTRLNKVVAGTGFNIIYYKDTLMWSNMIRNESKGNSNDKVGTYSLCTFKWNKDKIENIITVACTPFENKFTASLNKTNNEGDPVFLMKFPNYVKNQKQIMDNGKYQDIINIFEKFSKGEEEYISKGKPHKETILLYGPPGTGKTNLVRHLCAKFNFDLVSIKPETVTDESFIKRTWESGYYGGYTVYLVEDICSHPNYTINDKTVMPVVNSVQELKAKDDSTNKPTLNGVGSLSTLLNSLDGAVPLHNCIVILTTNNVNRLEKSIYRAGRVDHHIHMDYIEYNIALNYLGWEENDERVQGIQSVKDRLHVVTLRDLKYAETLQDVETIIKGGEICLNLDKHVEK